MIPLQCNDFNKSQITLKSYIQVWWSGIRGEYAKYNLDDARQMLSEELSDPNPCPNCVRWLTFEIHQIEKCLKRKGIIYANPNIYNMRIVPKKYIVAEIKARSNK